MVLSDIQKRLLEADPQPYYAYYRGVIDEAALPPDICKIAQSEYGDTLLGYTSENIFKIVINTYATGLTTSRRDLQGFNKALIPLLIRGVAPCVIHPNRTLTLPENYTYVTDGDYTIAAIFTRSINRNTDFVTFIDSNGVAQTLHKPTKNPHNKDFTKDWQPLDTAPGYQLHMLTLPDTGFGPTLAALQNRINASIITQTRVADMYARPFWYLLNTYQPPDNPHTDNPQATPKASKPGQRIFITDSQGPFGQLTPPTLKDVVDFHNTILEKVTQTTGIPPYYFTPGSGTPPTGVALKVISERYRQNVQAMRDTLNPTIQTILTDIGAQPDTDTNEYIIWQSADDLTQDALDAHGLALTTMGYPLEYVATQVTPGVDLAEYETDQDF